MNSESEPNHIHLTTRIEGFVLPTWAAVSLAIAALLSTLTLAFTIILATQQVSIMTREIRSLQLYVLDVENVMIRHNIATRSDFANHPIEESKEKTDATKGNNTQ